MCQQRAIYAVVIIERTGRGMRGCLRMCVNFLMQMVLKEYSENNLSEIICQKLILAYRNL